ncbi:hypothetical protein [Actinoplanes sp. CA-252034]|uniref:hypothetical protein n=1 Tax=Actinoplanes sp. CA-252034 TaxID=3239906 RepID=UPI003D976A15
MPVFPRRLSRRSAVLLAALMALFLLAVSQLTPGNARGGFAPGVDSPVVVAVQKACGHEHTGDEMPSEGRPQSDAWSPAAAPRVRPPADTIGVLLPDLRTVPGSIRTAASPADAAPLPGADPSQPGVLRI